MPSAYDELVKSGCAGSLKRDILLEASADLEYVSSIHHQFTDASAAAARDAVACTVILINELIARGLCSLATWSDDGTDPTILNTSQYDLVAIVSDSIRSKNVFMYFLLASDAGRAWVARYEALVAEL